MARADDSKRQAAGEHHRGDLLLGHAACMIARAPPQAKMITDSAFARVQDPASMTRSQQKACAAAHAIRGVHACTAQGAVCLCMA